METASKKRKLEQTQTLEDSLEDDSESQIVLHKNVPLNSNSILMPQTLEKYPQNAELLNSNDVGFEHGDEIEEVIGANLQGTQLMLCTRWKGKDQCSFVPAEVVNARAPEKVIQFYQSRILFVCDPPQPEVQQSFPAAASPPGLPVAVSQPPLVVPSNYTPRIHTSPRSNPPIEPPLHGGSPLPSPIQNGGFGTERGLICIVQQPPREAVYQRILKPFPTILLTGSVGKPGDQLYVQASMLRGDSETELHFLDGKKIIQISIEYPAIFKKLKIVSTSQQQGTLFRLRFQLKKYVNNTMEDIPGACCITTPLEVFSHTQYLKKDSKSLPDPSIKAIIPPSGPPIGGNQAVILGANFCNSPNLRICFGREVILAEFYERGTLICKVPPRQQGPQSKIVPIHVSNNGQTYCQTTVTYTYDD